MSYFAAVLARTQDRWRGVEVDLDDCESIDDIADVAPRSSRATCGCWSSSRTTSTPRWPGWTTTDDEAARVPVRRACRGRLPAGRS